MNPLPREPFTTLFNRLPYDFRTAVFQTVCGEGLAVGVEKGAAFRRGNYYRRLFLYRLVCREWNQFILKCRMLWRYACREDHPAITRMAFRYARRMSMVWDLWRTLPFRGGAEPIWEAIGQRPIMALFLYHRGRNIDPVVQLLSHDSYASLKTAWIIVEHRLHAPDLTLFGSQPHPGLVELSLKAKVRLSFAPGCFPSLQRLSITGSKAALGALPKVDQLLTSVGQMDLRELRLHEYRCEIDSKKLDGFHPVQLPRLQHLAITNTPLGVIRRFLGGLDVPSCAVTELTSDGCAGVGDQDGSDQFMAAYAGYIGRALISVSEPVGWVWRQEMMGFNVGGRSFFYSRRYTHHFNWYHNIVIAQKSRDLRFLFAELRTRPFFGTIRIVSLADVDPLAFNYAVPLTDVFPNLEEIQIVETGLSIAMLLSYAIQPANETFLGRAIRIRVFVYNHRWLDNHFRTSLEGLLQARPQLQVILDTSACEVAVDPRPWTSIERLQFILPNGQVLMGRVGLGQTVWSWLGGFSWW